MTCEPETPTDVFVYDPDSLSWAQCVGDACVACHTKWPRPRRVLGVLPDGSQVFGCQECAAIIDAEPSVPAEERLFAAR